eukprot:NODE_354_length_10253_cov_0.271519.p7 type:complete len:131 gc:universal NODE_354_length_10253_cov_0.271519:98-490(+)
MKIREFLGSLLRKEKAKPRNAYDDYIELKRILKSCEQEHTENEEYIKYLEVEIKRMKLSHVEDMEMISKMKRELPEYIKKDQLASQQLKAESRQVEALKSQIKANCKSKMGLELTLFELRNEVCIATYSK